MKTYAIPFILWSAACIGLVVALLADGSIEILGTALISFPLFVVLLRSRSRLNQQYRKGRFMSRYRGPKVRTLRALGTPELPGLTRKKAERRPYPPGQHGQARRKLSEYALRLIEKQKLRMNYGLTERQLLRLFVEAAASKGNTAERLVELLERRLDNIVFRSGFARTIPAARQLILHGHVLVEGRKVNIPSFRVKAGHAITIHDRSKEMKSIAAALATPLSFPTEWLNVEADAKKVTVTSLPDATAIPFPIRLQLVVEFYSQRT